MRRILNIAILFCIFFTVSDSLSYGFTEIRFGPSWPKTISVTNSFYNRTAWGFDIDWGGAFHDRVGLGGYFGVMWKRFIQDTLVKIFDSTGGLIEEYETDRNIKRTMFVLGGHIFVDPFPDLIVHPVFTTSFGHVLLIYINRKYDDDDDWFLKDKDRYSGGYWGFLGKFGIDVHVNLSSKISLFAGGTYTMCRVRKRKWGTATRYGQDLSGPSARFGIRLSY